ncbi:MAG: hypothetical protein ACRDHZ_06120, partial [Ktedonobacteraceae bacterium]
LQEHQEPSESGPPWMRHRHNQGEQHRGPRPEIQALRHEAMEVARLFAFAGRGAINDPTKLARLRTIIEHTRKELNEMIYGDASSTNQPPPPTE